MNFIARSHNIDINPLCFQIEGKNISDKTLKISLLIIHLGNFLLNFKVHSIFSIKLFYRETTPLFIFMNLFIFTY